MQAEKYELQVALEKAKDKLMTMSNIRGIDDFDVDAAVKTSVGGGVIPPASEVAENMGVAQAIAVVKETVEVMKNKLSKVQDQENGGDNNEDEDVGSTESSDEEDDSEMESGREFKIDQEVWMYIILEEQKVKNYLRFPSWKWLLSINELYVCIVLRKSIKMNSDLNNLLIIFWLIW